MSSSAVGAAPVAAGPGVRDGVGVGRDWSGGSPWDGLPGGVVAPEAEVVVVPRPRVAARMDDDELVAALVEVEAVGRRVDAARVALAAEVAERSRRELGPGGLARRLGCRTAVELIQRVTGVAGVTAGRRIKVGTAVRAGTTITGQVSAPRFPAVAWGLEEGLLGVDAAVAVVEGLGACERVAGRTAVGVAEAEIVTAAVPQVPPGVRAEEVPPAWDADSVRAQVGLWAAVLDPDGTVPGAADAQRRGLAFGLPRHGLVPLKGLLLPEVAAALSRYADAWTNPRTPPVPTPVGPGDGPDPAPADPAAADPAAADDVAALADRRSRAQVLHDVLANALVVAARAVDTPSVAGAPPTLVVTVRQEDLTTGRGVAWVEGTPVPLATARHVGCAGTIERVVLGPGGRIVGLGSDQRCFTPQQRRAIAVRDGTCVIPGCHVPAGWCEVHHVIPHATDPTGTHTDNGVLLCWHHHRTLDTSGWQIRMRAGLPEVRPPGWLDHTRGWRQTR